MLDPIRELQKEAESALNDISNHWENNPLARLIDIIGELYEWERAFIGEINTETKLEHCKYELKKKSA